MTTSGRVGVSGESASGGKRVPAADGQPLQRSGLADVGPTRPDRRAAGGPPAERRRTKVARTLNIRQRLGAVLLAAVIVAVIVARLSANGSGPPPVPDLIGVNGYGGQLKFNFLADPEVKAILADRYGLEVQIDVIGSIAMQKMMCNGSLEDSDDFLWAGDQSSLQIYKNCGGTMVSSDNVYNSPLVLYSWAPIADALVAAGIAQFQADGAYTVDVARLVELMMLGETWASLGLPELHGPILVQTSDPNQSNSGFLFAGLLANTLNGGIVVNSTTAGPLLSDIHDYFARLGYLVGNTGDLFEQFLTTGIGAKPMIVAYESQVMEFLAEHPSYLDQIKRDLRILYPQPTVWASHPLIARTDNGDRLLNALKDPDIQRLAWERHGQRPGVPGVPFDPAVFGIPGILKDITSAINMPGQDVMPRILEAIAGLPDSTPTSAAPSPLATTPARTWVGRGRRRPRPRRSSWPARSKRRRRPVGSQRPRLGKARGRGRAHALAPRSVPDAPGARPAAHPALCPALCPAL